VQETQTGTKIYSKLETAFTGRQIDCFASRINLYAVLV